MATSTTRHAPEYLQFPNNNNRTAWRPFGIANVLCVPHRRDNGGAALSNSNVFNVRVFVEGVPQEARIAGQQHIGQRFPDHELYAVALDSLALADRQIVVADYPILRDGVEIEYTDAKEGDLIRYTTSTGVTDTMPFFPDADYYDMSDVTVTTETLPSDHYVLVYQADYYYRLSSGDELNEFLCVDVSRTARTQLRFKINHPGEVLDEAYHLTPPPYLTDGQKALDSTVTLYRPFTDIIQDVMDEQDLLQNVNWVYEASPEAIPYLSALLGWDIPYFPQSVDNLRRAVLRRTVELQNLAGSRRAIVNLFRLFGFEILITNLWWSSDGKRFIRPGQQLPPPYGDEEISMSAVGQVDLLLNGWDEEGFGQFTIPFLFRPQEQSNFDEYQAARDGGDITIEAYTVARGSAAHTLLEGIASTILDNPEEYGADTGVSLDSNGFLASIAIAETLDGQDVLGFSQVLLSGVLGQATKETLVGQLPPLKSENVTFDRERNRLSLVLNGHLDSSDTIVYAFAIYTRQKIVVPNVLKDLQSNRFDVQVVSKDLAEFADPTTLEFAIEFLYRLKAFHSLLHVIRTRIELTETYQVTDFCVGGDKTQRFDIDAGRLQVPPAIIPNLPADISDCTKLDPRSLGYKNDDLALRLRILTNLPEEHAAWAALDARNHDPNSFLDLPVPAPAPGRTNCLYTYRGQDRIGGDRVEDRDIEDRFTREFTDIRTPLCTLNGADYCYKGRVDDEILYQQAIVLPEYPRTHACSLGLGVGLYYTYPAYSVPITPGTDKPAIGSKTSRRLYSGSARRGNQQIFRTPVTDPYLSASYDQRLPVKNNSKLGRLYRDYGVPTTDTLHYTNRTSLSLSQRDNLALQRPNLLVEKTTMHLPGCRFVLMSALADDFTHTTYTARPWDDPYSTYCGPKGCQTDPTFLNCVLVADDSGNETMRFDSAAYSVAGNGLTPDVPTLGDPTSSTIAFADVVHAVYMHDADTSPYVTLDQVCPYDSAVDSDGTISTDPIFKSHGNCGTDGVRDFADGYACLSGTSTYNGTDFGDYAEVLDDLGMEFLDDVVPTGEQEYFIPTSGDDGFVERNSGDLPLPPPAPPSLPVDTISTSTNYIPLQGFLVGQGTQNWFRFTGLGRHATSVKIRLTVNDLFEVGDAEYGEFSSVHIRAYLADNATPPTSFTDYLTRTFTTATAIFNPSFPYAGGDVIEIDITSVYDEIATRAGWSGTLMLNIGDFGSDVLIFYSLDGGFPAELVVEYPAEASTTVLFNLGSGILDGDGLRLDCGCLLAGCAGTDETDTICNSNHYLDDDGNYDWNADQLVLTPYLKLEEPINTCSKTLNGSIPSLLETAS